jgi:hypothetical protein
VEENKMVVQAILVYTRLTTSQTWELGWEHFLDLRASPAETVKLTFLSNCGWGPVSLTVVWKWVWFGLRPHKLAKVFKRSEKRKWLLLVGWQQQLVGHTLITMNRLVSHSNRPMYGIYKYFC